MSGNWIKKYAEEIWLETRGYRLLLRQTIIELCVVLSIAVVLRIFGLALVAMNYFLPQKAAPEDLQPYIHLEPIKVLITATDCMFYLLSGCVMIRSACIFVLRLFEKGKNPP